MTTGMDRGFESPAPNECATDRHAVSRPPRGRMWALRARLQQWGLCGLLALGAAASPAWASVATVGWLADSRCHVDSNGSVSIGSYPGFQVLRGILQEEGHALAAPSPRLTVEYLDGITHLFLGLLQPFCCGIDAAEQSALLDWVDAGGVLLFIGENSGWTQPSDTVLAPFGLGQVGGVQPFGGRWTSAPDEPLLQGITANSTLNARSSNRFAPGDYVVLAEFVDPGNEGPAIVTRQVGQGRLIATLDADLLFDANVQPSTRTFLANVLALDGETLPRRVFASGFESDAGGP